MIYSGRLIHLYVFLWIFLLKDRISSWVPWSLVIDNSLLLTDQSIFLVFFFRCCPITLIVQIHVDISQCQYLVWIYGPPLLTDIAKHPNLVKVLGCNYSSMPYFRRRFYQTIFSITACTSYSIFVHYYVIITALTHQGRDKMDAISQTTLSNAFSWMKI